MTQRMSPSRSWKRGVGLLRTLLVGTATLAVLLVLFSVYQATQKKAPGVGPKAADATTTVEPQTSGGAAPPNPTETGSTDVAPNVRIGGGSRPVITLYGDSGSRSDMELEAEDWKWVGKDGRQLEMHDPVIRLSTRDGRRVNVRAQYGFMEMAANRSSRGGGLDPQRGTLSGRVRIDIDRFTEAQREELPPERRDVVTPERLVQVEFDRMEFDRISNQIRVLGEIRMSAYELTLEARDLDMRFDSIGGRVEYFRLGEGRRLELRGVGEEFFARDSTTVDEAGMLSVPELVRRLSIHAKAPEAEAIQEPDPFLDEPYFDAEGALVLLPRPEKPDSDTRSTVTYLAKFERDVEIVQVQKGQEIGRLKADLLTLLKDFGGEERKNAEQTDPAFLTTAGERKPPSIEDRLTLTWRGPLTLEGVVKEEPLGAGGAGASEGRFDVTAHGSPVWVRDSHGTGRCNELLYRKNQRQIVLVGTRDNPVSLEHPLHGSLTAIKVTTLGDDRHRTLVAEGPGVLEQRAKRDGTPGSSTTTEPRQAGVSSEPVRIDFDQKFEAHLSYREGPSLDLRTFAWDFEDRLVLEQVVFTGGARVSSARGELIAPWLELNFDAGEKDSTILSSLRADGGVRVTMGDQTQGDIASRRLDVDFDTTQGAALPRRVRAFGEVSAHYEGSTLAARDRIDFEFLQIPREPQPLDFLAVYSAALRNGEDPAAIDWDGLRRASQLGPGEELVLRRIIAMGAVHVEDPERELLVTGQHLDCTLNHRRELDRAVIVGLSEEPAVVAMGRYGVKAVNIRADVPNQWAEVPGPGVMRFLSSRDLDGRDVPEPIEIRLAWADHMRFLGADNIAVFEGGVRAESLANHFRCDSMRIDFEEATSSPQPETRSSDLWIFERVVKGWAEPFDPGGKSVEILPGGNRFDKKPIRVEAIGAIEAQMNDFDGETDELASRATLRARQLFVESRPSGPGMRVVGVGDLLLEQYSSEPARNSSDSARLLGFGAGAEPSQTLVQWSKGMDFDQGLQRCLFEGQVFVTHLSGDKIRGMGNPPPSASAAGRDSTLACERLTLDWMNGGPSRAGVSAGERLNTRRLKMFRAAGNVELLDEGLSLIAGDLVYEKSRELLYVVGRGDEAALLTVQRPQTPVRQFSAKSFTYNLITSEFDANAPRYRGP